jgi:putative transposon-encoded protein
MKFELEGTDMKRTTVAKMSKGAHVYLPKEWIGKEVVVVLIE